MAPHTWSHLGDTVSDTTHHLYYRGQRIKEAYYRGECVWREGDEEDESVEDVRFIDWDGTLLKTYSAEKFIKEFDGKTDWEFSCHCEWTPETLVYSALDDYPDEAKHWNSDEVLLTPDGYNWSVEGAVSFVKKYGYLDIGCLYTTPCVLVWRYLPPNLESYTERLWIAGDGTIDWGDGTTESFSVSASGSSHISVINSYVSHEYSSYGQYLVKIYSDNLLIGRYGFYLQYISGSYRSYANISGIDGIFRSNYLNPTTSIGHTYAVYFTASVNLGPCALEQTYCHAVGMPNGFNFQSNCSEALSLMLGITRHLTFPSSVTTLARANLPVGSYNYAPYSSLIIYNSALDLNFLYTLSLPENASLELGLISHVSPSTCFIKRLIFTEQAPSIGWYYTLPANTELVVIPLGVAQQMISADVRWTQTIDPNPNLKIVVPKYVKAEYLYGSSDSGWVDGVTALAPYFPETLRPYLVAAEAYEEYWKIEKETQNEP